MNKIFLSGNLTRDVELKYSAQDTAYARVGIAVNRPFSKNKEVDFFNLVAFGKTAEIMNKYLAKGSRIIIDGRLQTSKYKDKDGTERTSTEIIIDNFEFANSKQKAADNSDFPNSKDVNDLDTPF